MRPELVVVALTRDPIDHRVHATAASQPARRVSWGGWASRCAALRAGGAEARALRLSRTNSRVVVKCVKLGLLSDEFLCGGLDGDEVR